MVEVRSLEWDSTFFGLRIARVEGHALTAPDVDSLRAWCRRERVDCVYFLADALDAGSAAVAENVGFRCVDERVTLEVDLAPARPAPGTHRVRPATKADIAALEAIAGAAHRDTRFFNDGGFPLERCAELYRTWIRNSCLGTADVVWVSNDAHGPVGYASCHVRSGGLGDIGLVGVAERARGRRYGEEVVAAALGWLRDERHCLRALVVTQGRNLGALRLYQRAGFAVVASQLWYHWWPERSAS